MPFYKCYDTKTVKVTAYPVPLTPNLILVFRRFAAHYMEYKIPMKTRRIIDKFGRENQFTSYTGWSQLRHHGLIREKGQEWSLTQRGEDFYLGKIQIYSIAGAWRSESFGDTIEENEVAWDYWRDSKKMRRRLVFIEEITPEDDPQPTREEFADNLVSASQD